MAMNIYKLEGLALAENFLRGGIVSGPVKEGGLYLNGKTLIFTAPAAETVTFASTPAGPQVPMSLQEVVTQIKAQTTGVDVKLKRTAGGSQLILVETSPTPGGVGVAITGAGTANAALGFGDDAVSGTVYNTPGGAAPALVSLAQSPINAENYTLVTDE